MRRGTLLAVRNVRVYDVSRQPHDWMDIVQPGQYVVFASLVAGGHPCDTDGVATSHERATCVIVDSLAAAELLCRDGVERHPEVQFDVFDAAGRSKPPTLTVVHPSHTSRLEGSPGIRRRNLVIAVVLIILAPVLFWLDWRSGGALILPTLLAFNALLFAGRLLQLNVAYASAERRRDIAREDRGRHETPVSARGKGIDS